MKRFRLFIAASAAAIAVAACSATADSCQIIDLSTPPAASADSIARTLSPEQGASLLVGWLETEGAGHRDFASILTRSLIDCYGSNAARFTASLDSLSEALPAGRRGRVLAAASIPEYLAADLATDSAPAELIKAVSSAYAESDSLLSQRFDRAIARHGITTR